MDIRSQNTLIFAEAGLINNPNICIKGMTTCVCVCKSCMEETDKAFDELLREWEESNH